MAYLTALPVSSPPKKIALFDRLCDAKLLPIEGEWRTGGLDTVEVEFALLRGLAHAYEPKPHDQSDLAVGDADVPKRVIRRNVTNTFWFIREVLPYGKDCVVITPVLVRDRVVTELKSAIENY